MTTDNPLATWSTRFERVADRVTRAAGSSSAFLFATSAVLIWAMIGPLFDYSESWQLVINTGTTIVTFLMVFLIQKSQNKDSMAIQLKLNELIAASKGASNRLIDAENMTEGELRILHEHYCTMVEITQRARNLKESHSVEEAIDRTEEKLEDEAVEDAKAAFKRKKAHA